MGPCDVFFRFGRSLLIGCLLLGGIREASAQGRVALVVGNSAYRAMPVLANTANDARLIATTLGSLGFTLIGGGPRIDLDKAGFEAALLDFYAALSGAQVATFYFAGQGVRINDADWLLPVDVDPTRPGEITAGMIDVASMLSRMAQSKSRVNVVILDAARQNPFTGRGFERAAPGLALLRAPDRTLIAYPAQPGEVIDGSSSGVSPYTMALIESMLRPGINISIMFERVGIDVVSTTRGKQRPWFAMAPISADIAFGTAGARVAPPVAPPAVPPPRTLMSVAQPASGDANPVPLPVVAPAPPSRAQPATAAITRDCPDCPELVLVPAGSFAMGVPEAESRREGTRDADRDARPVHTVRIANPFLLAEYPVTRGQYAVFARATGRSVVQPSFFQTDSHPVVDVSWHDAQAYIAWLGQRTGKAYRLPSEAEWEYAARAGTTAGRFWGDTTDAQCAYANGWDQSAQKVAALQHPVSLPGAARCEDGFPFTSPVGSFRPNRFGLYDMLGNVFQWVSDCHSDGYGAPADQAPSGDAQSDCVRVARGGSWITVPSMLRVGVRYAVAADLRTPVIGFRVARPASP